MTHWATYTGITNQLWDRGLINVTVKSIRIADIGGGQVQMYSECQVEARVMLKDLLLRFSLTSTYEKVVDSSINFFATRKPNQRLWTDCVNGMHRVELFIRTTLCFIRGNRYVCNLSYVLQIIESFFFTFSLSFLFVHTLHQVFAILQSVHKCFSVQAGFCGPFASILVHIDVREGCLFFH